MAPLLPTDANEKAKREAMEYLRLRIEYHVKTLPENAVSEVVSALSMSPVAKATMEFGFGGQLDENARVSFSEFCIDHGAVDVLRAVLAAAPAGIDLRSTCCGARKMADSVWEGWRQSVHQHAVKTSNPEALRLALEIDPKDRCLRDHSQVLGGTLHAYALVRVFKSEDVDSAAECCRILLGAKAPMAERGSGAGFASGIFFDSEEWEPERLAVIERLLPEYIAHGLIDIDQPSVGLKGDYEGLLPLRAAMVQGNYTGAAMCIDLGCDIDLAMKTRGLRMSTAATEILVVARSLVFDTAELEHKMVASITAALMRRQLSGAAVTPASDQPAAEATVPRRRRLTL